MNEDFVARLGSAAARWSAARGAQAGRVLIGRDTRASGAPLTRAFAAGLATAGAGPVSLGVIPTPAVSRAVRLGGAALGALNPVGPRLVAYPLTVLTHHQAFSKIAEWQSPNFSDPVNVVFLAMVLLAVILLVARRGTIEDALVLTLFTGAALAASRNVPVAALVVTPVLARGVAGLGTLDGTERGVGAGAVLVVLAALGFVMAAGALRHPAYDLSAYPVAEVTWMQDHGLVPGRVAAPDYVGNYLEWRYGTGAHVFVDDRVDIFPSAVIGDYDVLLGGEQAWKSVLARYRFTAVLWPRNEPLASLVAEDPAWSVRVLDRHWLVAVPSHPAGR